MTDYTELQRAAEYAAQDTIKFADESEEMRALQQFHEEVDPETVLALIAENERIQEAHEQICTSYNQVSYASEERGKQIDQLKAELEHTGYDHDLLRNERDQLKAENERLRSGMKGDYDLDAWLDWTLEAEALAIELPEPYAVVGDYAACGGGRSVWDAEYAEKIDDRMCQKTPVYDRASLEAAGVRVKS